MLWEGYRAFTELTEAQSIVSGVQEFRPPNEAIGSCQKAGPVGPHPELMPLMQVSALQNWTKTVLRDSIFILSRTQDKV